MNFAEKQHILSTIEIIKQCLKSLEMAVLAKDPVAQPMKSLSPQPEIGEMYASQEEEKNLSDFAAEVTRDLVDIGEVSE